MTDTSKETLPRLKKSMGLFDVYAIATGSMFSSGLFLLPGIAASYTGNSVYLAYLAAGLLILPALFCMAEFATAPRCRLMPCQARTRLVMPAFPTRSTTIGAAS